MRIRVNAGETHLSIPAPTLIVLNTPVLWAYLTKNGHPLPYSRCADLIHALRNWKKRHPDIPLVEINVRDGTCVRIEL